MRLDAQLQFGFENVFQEFQPLGGVEAGGGWNDHKIPQNAGLALCRIIASAVMEYRANLLQNQSTDAQAKFG